MKKTTVRILLFIYGIFTFSTLFEYYIAYKLNKQHDGILSFENGGVFIVEGHIALTIVKFIIILSVPIYYICKLLIKNKSKNNS